jgi:hypothetical protein
VTVYLDSRCFAFLVHAFAAAFEAFTALTFRCLLARMAGARFIGAGTQSNSFYGLARFSWSHLVGHSWANDGRV